MKKALKIALWVLSGVIGAWILFWVVFAVAINLDLKFRDSRLHASVNGSSLLTTSSHPFVFGHAGGTKEVYVSLADSKEEIWHNDIPIPVTDGAWSVTVSPDYSLPPNEYILIVKNGPSASELDRETLTILPK